MFVTDTATVGRLKELIKDLPDKAKLIISVDPTDQKTPEKDFDRRYQSEVINALSYQNGRLIFSFYDMDKNFVESKNG